LGQRPARSGGSAHQKLFNPLGADFHAFQDAGVTTGNAAVGIGHNRIADKFTALAFGGVGFDDL